MEELITTVFLVWFNFALGIRDTATYQAGAAAYHEVEARNNLPEWKPLLHHHAHQKKRIQPERKPLTNRLWHIREGGHPPLLIRKFMKARGNITCCPAVQ